MRSGRGRVLQESASSARRAGIRRIYGARDHVSYEVLAEEIHSVPYCFGRMLLRLFHNEPVEVPLNIGNVFWTARNRLSVGRVS